MSPKDTPFVTCKRRKGRYVEDLDLEEIRRENIDSNIDTTGSPTVRGKGTREEDKKIEFNSLINSLNDLAKGQKEMLHAINRLANKQGQAHNKLQVTQGNKVSTSNSGRHEYTTMQNTPHIYNKTSRPTMPQFMENPTVGQIVPSEPEDPFGAYLEEYRALGDDFHSTMTFSYFCNMKSRNRPRGFNKAFNHNFELRHTMGKLTIPNFDGTTSCSAIIWV